MYTSFTTDPHIVSSRDRYLFDKSLEERCSDSNQYLRCWLRSVDIAMELQATQQDQLRQQASQFFQRRQPASPIPEAEHYASETASLSSSMTSREQRLHQDISSPASYNLRRRTWRIDADSSSSIDGQAALEPSCFYWKAHDIFWASDSSYNPSIQRDVAFCPDSDFSIHELQDPGYHTAHATDSSDDSTYQQSSLSYSSPALSNIATSNSPQPSSSSQSLSGNNFGEPNPFCWMEHDIFWASDSSYSASIRRDLPFHPDSPFSFRELQDSSQDMSHMTAASSEDCHLTATTQRLPTFHREERLSPGGVSSSNPNTGILPVLPFRSTLTTLTEEPALQLHQPSEVMGMLRFLQERRQSNSQIRRQPQYYPMFHTATQTGHIESSDGTTERSQHIPQQHERRYNRKTWFPPKTIHIPTIPITELDDPPDGNPENHSGGRTNIKDNLDFLRSSDSALSLDYG